MMRSAYLFLSMFLLFGFRLAAQQNDSHTVADMEELLEKKNFRKADSILKNRLPLFIREKNTDTLSSYVVYIGKVASALRGKDKGAVAILDFIREIKKQFPYHGDITTIYFRSADYFRNQADPQQAYDLITELKQYFSARPDSLKPTLHRAESNLGSYAMAIGNYGLSSDHYRESLRLLNQIKNPDMAEVFIGNNSMGIAMWYASKLDSCLYYFEKAVAALQQQDSTPLNRNFRVAMLQNNMGNVYNEMGRADEAIQHFNKAIDNYQRFISTPEPHMRKEYAAQARLQAIDNLAKTYNELGDYTKGQNLLQYAYAQKVNNYGAESPEAYKSLVYLGSQFYTQRDYVKARSHLTQALQLIKAHSEEAGIWEADAYTFLALVNSREGKIPEAENYFQQAAEVYKQILKEGYSAEYLQYLNEAAVFYASNLQRNKAITLADKALNYAIQNQGEKSLVSFYQVINAAEVHYINKDYQQAIKYSEQGLRILDQLVAGSESLLDSILIEKEKPNAILLQVKSAYEITPDKSEKVLTDFLNKMKEAVQVLEKRKTIFTEAKDINTLNATYKELHDFVKTLQLELYEKTGKGEYLNDLVNLHEAGIYSRIRSRLDKRRNGSFLHVPENVLKEEEDLKAAIGKSLLSKRNETKNLQHYLEAINKLNAFKNMLRDKYPDYYQMRYAAAVAPELATIAKKIPVDQTVIRFLVVNKKLLALVMDQQQQQWIALPGDNMDSLVTQLTQQKNTPALTGHICHALYQQLWQPLEKNIRHKRIVIIPDGILYHLSFEMLSQAPAANFTELAAQALLNKYAISYHYSLLAIKPAQQQRRKNGNFVAFTPGFSDEEKQRYREDMINDSVHLDNTYLSLIPLPFTVNLARKVQRRLGGDLFVSNRSTPEVFRSKAGDHTIIHIGTHAEASNISPEFSRLIFAKDVESRTEENSLYLFDIYNCNLSADLAVLTACETGKPGYQDGEGMISMAHAFSYAGSESIMTGLWKIDEQASTMISEYFYQNLQNGMTKDVALQQAKIRYLADADQRMLSPEYWAGLVIMGDTSAVQLAPKNNKAWLLAGGLGLAALLVVFLWRGRKRKIAA